MGVYTSEIQLSMKGNGDIQDLTPQVESVVGRCGFSSGVVCLFIVGSTAALSTVEFEPGLVHHDLPRLFEQLAPENAVYEHEKQWHDDNGHSHVRATLMGPSLMVPFVNKKMTLGTWQQLIAIDFDTRSRQRRIVAQVMGE